MGRAGYQIHVLGAIGPAARAAFAGLLVEIRPPHTIISGELDQPSLHQLIERIEGLGLELVEVRRLVASTHPRSAIA